MPVQARHGGHRERPGRNGPARGGLDPAGRRPGQHPLRGQHDHQHQRLQARGGVDDAADDIHGPYRRGLRDHAGDRERGGVRPGPGLQRVSRSAWPPARSCGRTTTTRPTAGRTASTWPAGSCTRPPPSAAVALDAATGAQLWSRTLIGNDHEGIAMAPGYDHGTVYVSTVPANVTTVSTAPAARGSCGR